MMKCGYFLRLKMQNPINNKFDYIYQTIDQFALEIYKNMYELDNTFSTWGTPAHDRRELIDRHLNYLRLQIGLLQNMVSDIDPSPLDDRAVIDRIYELTIEPLMEPHISFKINNPDFKEKTIIYTISRLIGEEVYSTEKENNGEVNNE